MNGLADGAGHPIRHLTGTNILWSSLTLLHKRCSVCLNVFSFAQCPPPPLIRPRVVGLKNHRRPIGQKAKAFIKRYCMVWSLNGAGQHLVWVHRLVHTGRVKGTRIKGLMVLRFDREKQLNWCVSTKFVVIAVCGKMIKTNIFCCHMTHIDHSRRSLGITWSGFIFTSCSKLFNVHPGARNTTVAMLRNYTLRVMSHPFCRVKLRPLTSSSNRFHVNVGSNFSFPAWILKKTAQKLERWLAFCVKMFILWDISISISHFLFKTHFSLIFKNLF